MKFLFGDHGLPRGSFLDKITSIIMQGSTRCRVISDRVSLQLKYQPKILSSSPPTYSFEFSSGIVRHNLTHYVHLKRELELLQEFDSLPSHLARMPSQGGGSSLRSISPTSKIHPSKSK